MKLVLLDFDGVINDSHYLGATEDQQPEVIQWSPCIGRDMLDPTRVARVQAVCDATGASVLLVTGWRKFATADVLTGILRERGLTAPVLGAVGGVKFSGDMRAQASHEWLKDHREVTRFVILDDNPFYWSDKRWKAHRVAIWDGIEEEHVQQAIEILNRE